MRLCFCLVCDRMTSLQKYLDHLKDDVVFKLSSLKTVIAVKMQYCGKFDYKIFHDEKGFVDFIVEELNFYCEKLDGQGWNDTFLPNATKLDIPPWAKSNDTTSIHLPKKLDSLLNENKFVYGYRFVDHDMVYAVNVNEFELCSKEYCRDASIGKVFTMEQALSNEDDRYHHILSIAFDELNCEWT